MSHIFQKREALSVPCSRPARGSHSRGMLFADKQVRETEFKASLQIRERGSTYRSNCRNIASTAACRWLVHATLTFEQGNSETLREPLRGGSGSTNSSHIPASY